MQKLHREFSQNDLPLGVGIKVEFVGDECTRVEIRQLGFKCCDVHGRSPGPRIVFEGKDAVTAWGGFLDLIEDVLTTSEVDDLDGVCAEDDEQ